MDTIREQIYLAALLHDIGKFYQRADNSLSSKEHTLSDYSKRIAEDICPINDNGRFGYQHVIWSSEFLESVWSKIQSIPEFNNNLYGNKNSEDSLVSFACNHHKPRTEWQAIVTMADWWSAGIDRTDPTTFETDESASGNINWGKQRYKHIPLFSVFNNLNGGHYNSAFKLNALNLKEQSFFPVATKSAQDGVCQNDYASLWKAFRRDFDRLPTDSFDGFAESLLYLLKKYTWCIPSNTMDMANVSLYEHLKTTAAFADALYRFKLSIPEAFEYDKQHHRLSIVEGTKPILLLGGDISGIQRFIYSISSRKAAVSLKGRSFYLQLLIDSIIQRIITHKDIDCTIGQVVYSSGGKFYILLPNTGKVKSAIRELTQEFEEELWKKHYGQLTLNISYIPFCFDQSLKTLSIEGSSKPCTIGELWKELADKLTKCKYLKFKSLITDRYDNMFEPQPVKQFSTCSVTGIEGECVPIDSSVDDDKKAYVLRLVEEQAKLGKALKDADYIVTYREPDGNSHIQGARFDIEIAGIHNYLFDQKDLTQDNAEFRYISSADVCRVKRINDTNCFGINLKGHACSYGFQFYGGNKQAQSVEFSGKADKTFEELAGNTYLGVLRMDVDNLGSLFIKGLPESARSFAAYSTLSFMLDYFFSGFLNTIRERVDFVNDVDILYSGGDDVFAIGRWDKLILFAEAVRKDFEKFIGRSDISISAGITLIDEKFPIAKAAQMAGKAEDDAKAFNNGAKNAVNLFGESVSWSQEYDFVKRYKDTFASLIKDENMPRSILHRLMNLCILMRKGEVSYIWHTAYFLKRFSEGKSESIKSFCKDLTTITVNQRNYELIAIAARWAELVLKIQ